MQKKATILMTFAKNDLPGVKIEAENIYNSVHTNDLVKGVKIEDADIDTLAEAIIDNNEDLLMFHYSGHADQHNIVLDGLRNLDNIRLSNLLLPKENHNLSIVFLNGCLSSGHVGTLTARGVKVIIATNVKVDDKEAVKLSKLFYKCFFENNYKLKSAFESAEASVTGKNSYPIVVNPGAIYETQSMRNQLSLPRSISNPRAIDETQSMPASWTLFVHSKYTEVLEWTLEDFINGFQKSKLDNVGSVVNVDRITTNNLVIQGVSEDKITILVDGKTQEIEKKLDVLQALMKQLATTFVQTAGNIYNIGSITPANFGFIAGQAGKEKSLPTVLSENLVGEGNAWVQSLRMELKDHGVSVGNEPQDVFKNYGWLVERFLQKMSTPAGEVKDLRRLSFMAEAWQASLRYLCYIQMAQIFQLESKPKPAIISEFARMEGNSFLDFDYTSLLLVSTDVLGSDGFIKEINEFVEELTDTESTLFDSALYLQSLRQQLMANTIIEDEKLPGLLDEYLTALVFWLRKISFLAKYRLVSMKEITLDYSLGTAKKKFDHMYGEVHGVYNGVDSDEEDSKKEEYSSKIIEGAFTFNKSVLLFRGMDVAGGMDRINEQNVYLSLSPLVIDQSVYADMPKQTPEIFYFTGFEKVKRQYNFARNSNELAFGGKVDMVSNKYLKVMEQNNSQKLLNKLFGQLDNVFKPFKNKQT